MSQFIRQHHKVKGPILIPFSLVLLLGLGALLGISYQYEEHARQHDLANSVRAVERLFRLQIDNDAAKLQATLCPISRDESIKAAFIDGDVDALLAKTAPLFQRLHDHHRVTHFYFLDTDRRVVLRVHRPDMRGDIIDRATMLDAQRNRHQSNGIELGPLGTLTLRAVKPWYQDGRLIGYLELGEEIDHVSREIHQALGVDLLVRVRREFMTGGEAGKEGAAGGGPFIISQTMDSIPSSVSAQLSDFDHAAAQTQQVLGGEQVLHTTLLPLRDAAGREIGDIAVVRDVTTLQAGFRRSVMIAVTLTLLAGAAAFAVFYVVLDRVERDYRRQRELETQFARLSTEHQRIVQIEKLSEVGRTIGEIAHQINNPLVGVVNMAQLAEREADDPTRVRELLANIRQAGADSHAFLQRMLAFTKISRFERRPTDINVLINETIALFQQSNDRQPVIDTRLPAAPLTLEIDPVLVRHALFNLLSNAAQVNPPGGQILISLLKKQGEDHRAGWSLEVRDQGPGLSEQVQAKLFTPFFTTQKNGTGLGLAVVQHVAMLHEGSATGANREGGGAVFALWLPDIQTAPGRTA